jgi:amidase
MNDIYNMSATYLQAAIQKRQIGVEELVRYYFNRIEKYDKAAGLNTIAELDESAIKTAKELDNTKSNRNLPLVGLPILVKDNIDINGLHSTAGSLALEDNSAKRDAPVIANLRKNGAIILGKTNMTEFANYTSSDMPNGFSARGGQVRNAYNRDINPSGSSTGSAVAMSAGFCAAAVGTDTSFSIIVCAAVNGVTGLMPPHGVLSTQGIIPISHTLDSAGPLTYNFSDALLIYSGMRDTPLPPFSAVNPGTLNIAVNTFNRDKVPQAQLMKYDTLIESLKSAGARFTNVSHEYKPHLRSFMQYEFKHDLEEYLKGSTASRKSLQEIVRFYESNPDAAKYGYSHLQNTLENTSGKLNESSYLEALAERERIRSRLLNELRDYDTCIMTGPTNIMHFTGLPSVALKHGMNDDGTPIGIILYGADEIKLYAAALTIEAFCEPVTPPVL